MREALVVLVVFLSFGGGAQAAPCLPGTLQTYLDLGAGGCAAGSIEFKNFTIEPGLTFATPIDPLDVTVMPTVPAGPNGGVALLLDFGSLMAAPGDTLDLFFRFQTAGTGVFRASLELIDAAATGDGVITAIQDLCAGTFAGPGPTGCDGSATSLLVFRDVLGGISGGSASLGFAAPLDIFTQITLDGALAGSAGLGRVRLSFNEVPEPSTWILLLTGVAGAFIQSQRRRRRVA